MYRYRGTPKLLRARAEAALRRKYARGAQSPQSPTPACPHAGPHQKVAGIEHCRDIAISQGVKPDCHKTGASEDPSWWAQPRTGVVVRVKRVFGNMRNLGRGESSGHDVDHGQMDHCLRGTCVEFIVLAHPPKPSQPCEGALHDPAMRQELESLDVVASLHDL